MILHQTGLKKYKMRVATTAIFYDTIEVYAPTLDAAKALAPAVAPLDWTNSIIENTNVQVLTTDE